MLLSTLALLTLAPYACDQDVDPKEVLRLMALRDRAELPVRLDYTVWTVPGRETAGISAPDASTHTRETSGWLWFDGDRLRGQVTVARDNVDRATTTFRWDGTVAEGVMRALGEPDPSRWPGVRLRERSPYMFVDAANPLNFGYAYLGQSWPDCVEASENLAYRGRETILGRSCAHFSMDYGAAAGEHFVPVDFWVDERESLLVLRSRSYEPLEVAVSGGRLSTEEAGAIAIDRDGVELVPRTTWEVKALEEVDGTVRPARGVLIRTGSDMPDHARVTVIEPRSMTVAAPEPQLDLGLPPGGIEFDRIRDSSTVVGSEGSDLDMRQANYWLALEDSGQLAVRECALAFDELDFESPRCGVYSALFLAHLHGKWCTTEELLHEAGVEPAADGSTSLTDVSAMIESQGLATVPVRTTLEALARWGKDVVAHTTSTRPLDPLSDEPPCEHFMVVRVSEGSGGFSVQFVNPPEKVRRMTGAEFEEIWSGKALMIDSDAGVLDAFLASEGGGSSRLLLLLVAVGGLGIFAAQRVRFRKEVAR